MAYLLDSNVFIQGKNDYYRFTVCPGFWDWIAAEHVVGKLLSIQAVKGELIRLGDGLSTWALAQPPSFFAPQDAATADANVTVSAWAARTTQYFPSALAAFYASPDFLLIGHALAYGHTLVTLEKTAPDSRATIKIPDVCKSLGVPFCDSFEMLEGEGAVFKL